MESINAVPPPPTTILPVPSILLPFIVLNNKSTFLLVTVCAVPFTDIDSITFVSPVGILTLPVPTKLSLFTVLIDW